MGTVMQNQFSTRELVFKLLGSPSTPPLSQLSFDCLETVLQVIAEYATDTNRTVDSALVVCELVQMNSLDRQHVEPVVRIMLSLDFEALSSVEEEAHPAFLLNKMIFYSQISDQALFELCDGGWGSDTQRTAIKNHFARLADSVNVANEIAAEYNAD